MPLDPEAKTLLDLIGITNRRLETMTPQAARDLGKAMVAARRQMGIEAVHDVRDVMIPGPGGEIPLRIYAPDISRPAPALIYFHGGGWVLGDLDSHDHVCRSLANRVPCIVLSADYRLGPEAKFPAAVDDAYAAAEWVAAGTAGLGIDPGRIAIGGDSAGGNLATVVTQLARDRKGPRMIYQLLIYPGTDMRMNWPSIEENADGPLLTKPAMVWFLNHYLRDEEDKTNPLASPLLASSLTGLPPAFILTAECDPIRDEGEAYGLRLQAAGVAVEVKRYAGMPHGFFSFAAALRVGRQAFTDAIGALRGAFALDEGSAESAA
ncbi:MAG TPA: alpha/beta hydrolase [Candidatus Sulfopaludibacter sp.]|nr:alpha/beta hydrolase [Candidatus Sulfopaludibacter sp.]